MNKDRKNFCSASEPSIERRCTKQNPCVPSEIKKNEFWIHEGAYEVDPDWEGEIFLFKCSDCGLEFFLDLRLPEEREKWNPNAKLVGEHLASSSISKGDTQ